MDFWKIPWETERDIWYSSSDTKKGKTRKVSIEQKLQYLNNTENICKISDNASKNIPGDFFIIKLKYIKLFFFFFFLPLPPTNLMFSIPRMFRPGSHY